MTKSLKILITGVAGFLGSHLAERLANMNHKVIGIDNMIGGYRDNVPKNIEFHEIENIIKYRCGVCHANKPTFEGFEEPPLGLILETSDDILKNPK